MDCSRKESDERCYILVTIPIISVFKTIKFESGGTCLLCQTQETGSGAHGHSQLGQYGLHETLSQLPCQKKAAAIYIQRALDTCTISSQNIKQQISNKMLRVPGRHVAHCNLSTREGMGYGI